MAQTITILVPDEIIESYDSPDELRRDLYEDIIVGAFQKGLLSIRESAKLLEMTYEEFIEWLGERKAFFINAQANELSQSYEAFESFMQPSKQP